MVKVNKRIGGARIRITEHKDGTATLEIIKGGAITESKHTTFRSAVTAMQMLGA